MNDILIQGPLRIESKRDDLPQWESYFILDWKISGKVLESSPYIRSPCHCCCRCGCY